MAKTRATPQHFLRYEILKRAGIWAGMRVTLGAVLAKIDDLWDAHASDGTVQDAMEEVRTSGYATKLRCDTHRNYDSEAVGMLIDPPGGFGEPAWIGWTHWYGGGKHSEPGAIEWLPFAYFLDVEEEPVTAVRRTFKRHGTKDRGPGIVMLDD